MKSDLRQNIGFALIFVGVPFGMYFNFMLPVVKWSPVFMTLSILLTMSYKNVISGKFMSFNRIFLLILVYQLLMIVYGIVSDNMSFQLLSFHLYIIILIGTLSTNDNKIDYNEIIKYIFLASTICIILGAFFLWTGLVVGEKAWLLRQENENYALEPFTVASGAVTNFISSLFLLTSKNKYLKILVNFSIPLDIYVLFTAGKRTPIAVCIAILLLYLYKKGATLELLRYFILLLLIGIMLYFNVDSIECIVNNFGSNFYNGVLNILGNTEVADYSGSAIERYNAREWAYKYMSTNFNFFNYLFGAGYMTRWLDNSLLQSYLDMGVGGLLLNIGIIVIYPLKKIWRKDISLLALFATLMCTYNILSCISSGHPYAYIKYTPVVILAFVLQLKTIKEKV